jgi:hypothetical protein
VNDQQRKQILGDEEQKKLHAIFFPYSTACLQRIEKDKTRFVHYTSAATAIEILRNKEFWMREPSCMNDYMEIEHGIQCIDKVYSGNKAGSEFRQLLNQLHPDIEPEVRKHFNHSPLNPRKDNYVACLSEHRNNEDFHGRLSMWRAYGNGTGIALVMNAQPIVRGPGNLSLLTSPVAYFEDDQFEDEMQKVVNNIKANMSFLKSLDPKIITIVVLNMLRLASLSSKHPGFQEECEWRLIYSPSIDSSPFMEKDIKVIGGIPQVVYKIPLKSTPSGEATGGEIPALIDRIIIGPTQYPGAMFKAFVSVLTDAGVPNPESKIHISCIPLRT